MSKLDVEVNLRCCGSVVDYLEPGEEPFDYEEAQLKKCVKCGKTDFPDAFLHMDLFDKYIKCIHCKKETEHTLIMFDAWSGTGETKCNSCNKINKFY